jgi:signal transduction histidine kinase
MILVASRRECPVRSVNGYPRAMNVTAGKATSRRAEPARPERPATEPLGAPAPVMRAYEDGGGRAGFLDHDSMGLFEWARGIVHEHGRLADLGVAAFILAMSTVWLTWSPYLSWGTMVLQAGLVAPLVWRRSNPSTVFVATCALAMLQWALGDRLVGDVAILVALYTVVVQCSRLRALLAVAVLEAGAVMAAVKWVPAGTVPRSFFFLSATVVAAFFIGLTVRSGSRYMAFLAERAARLELERDQETAMATAAERARIAREMHDIVAHNLSVVVTLADAAATVAVTDPGKAAQVMGQVSETGRQALHDIRATIGVLRTDDLGLVPQPGLGQLEALFDNVRATGVVVEATSSGEPFALGATGELSIYRIIQECLTNTIKHSSATTVRVELHYAFPDVHVAVTDNGEDAHQRTKGIGHGIEGMKERAALHSGSLWAGPAPGGGWAVRAAMTISDAVRPGGGSRGRRHGGAEEGGPG